MVLWRDAFVYYTCCSIAQFLACRRTCLLKKAKEREQEPKESVCRAKWWVVCTLQTQNAELTSVPELKTKAQRLWACVRTGIGVAFWRWMLCKAMSLPLWFCVRKKIVIVVIWSQVCLDPEELGRYCGTDVRTLLPQSSSAVEYKVISATRSH